MSHRCSAYRLALGALVTLAVLPHVAFGQDQGELPVPLATPQAQSSYGIGRQIGRGFTRDGLDADLLDFQALVQGIQDSLANAESKVSQEKFEAAMTQIQQTAQQRMQQKMASVAEKNRRDGPKFLEKYKALEGVKSTPSGLLYKVTQAGSGATPKDTDVVKTHYRGRLIDGTEFDSSYKRDEPAIFPVNQVIPGWTEALQMMKVGERRQLVIPSELAYGPQGMPPVIGPDAVLIFDIELLGIEPPDAGQN